MSEAEGAIFKRIVEKLKQNADRGAALAEQTEEDESEYHRGASHAFLSAARDLEEALEMIRRTSSLAAAINGVAVRR